VYGKLAEPEEGEHPTSPVPPLEGALQVTGRDEEIPLFQEQGSKSPGRISPFGILEGCPVDTTRRASVHIDECPCIAPLEGFHADIAAFDHALGYQPSMAVLYLSIPCPYIIACTVAPMHWVSVDTHTCHAFRAYWPPAVIKLSPPKVGKHVKAFTVIAYWPSHTAETDAYGYFLGKYNRLL